MAYNHCAVVRKSQELPEVRRAVSQGILTVSTVRHLAPVLTKENQKEMISLGSSRTQAELRRELAKRAPEQVQAPEKARYVREDRVALELRVSEGLMKELRRAQDLVSQSERKLVNLEETLQAMVNVFLDRKDPLRKAQRLAGKEPPAAKPGPCEEAQSSFVAEGSIAKEATMLSNRMIRKNEVESLKPKRTPIPLPIQRAVLLKNDGRCTHRTPSGTRCNQTRWLHFHHLKPLSQGGTHTIENVSLLCGGHHRMIHATS